MEEKWNSKKRTLWHGWFLGLSALCCLLWQVLNYNNADALNVSTAVAPTGKSWEVGTDLRCQFSDPNTGTTTTINGSIYGECNNPALSQLKQPLRLNAIYLNTNIDVIEGNYYTTYFQFSTNDFYNNVPWNINTSSDFTIVKFEEVVQQTMGNGTEISGTNIGTWTTTVYEVTLMAKTTGNVRFILGNTTKRPESLSVNYIGQYSISGIYEYKPANAAEAVEDQTKKEEERYENENNKAEEAANTKQETGADGSDEQAKEGLNLFKTILETPAGTCKLPEIKAFEFSLGELDLCAYQPPSWIQNVMGAIVSITLAGGSIKCTSRVLEELGRAYGGNK